MKKKKIELELDDNFVEIEEIEYFEKINSFLLPKEYKKFLLEVNGGYCGLESFKYDYIDIFGEKSYFCLSSLSSLENLKDSYFEKNNGMLSIGETIGDSQSIYICVSDEKYGRIFLQDSSSDDNFIELADSFETFLNNFSIDDSILGQFKYYIEKRELEKLKDILDNNDLSFIINENEKPILDFGLYDDYFIDIIKKFIEKGYKEKELLHNLVRFGCFEIIEYLLGIGFDINAKDNKGQTPIFYSINRSMIDFLIKNGADINIRDNNNNKPSEAIDVNFGTIEQKLYYKELVDLLKENEKV